MDGLPLALGQAGSFLRETSFSVDEYLEAWETEWENLVDEMGANHESRSIRTTWIISFEYVRRKGADGENAARLLQLSSFFDNTNIQHSLFVKPNITAWEPFTIENLPSWFQDTARSPLSLNKAIRMLSNYSLIEQNQASKCFPVHPVVHEWSYHFSLDIHADLCRTAAVVMAAGAVYNINTSFITTKSELLPHTRRLVQILDNKFGRERGQFLHDRHMRRALGLLGVVFRQDSEPSTHWFSTGVQQDPAYLSMLRLMR